MGVASSEKRCVYLVMRRLVNRHGFSFSSVVDVFDAKAEAEARVVRLEIKAKGMRDGYERQYRVDRHRVRSGVWGAR